MIVSLLFSLVLINFVHSKSVATKESCPQAQISYFVIDNAFMKLDDSIIYKDTSEDDCMKTCTRNRDQFDRPITCHSFTYDHASFSCTIHKEKAVPIGAGQIETTVGKRYFEKFCLPKSSVDYCFESQFIRVDQSVLVGYAVNMTLTDSMESCVAQCIQEKECKSAMYFYEDGECITNKESALTKPTGFTKEENDRVVYFQNGCGVTKNQPEANKSDDMENDKKTDEVEEKSAEEKPKVNIQISETTPKPVVESTVVDETVETSSHEENDTEYVEDDADNFSEEESDEDTTTEKLETETETETPEPTTTTTVEPIKSLPHRTKSLLQKKIKKHPKNFGSKTYEILKKETIKQPKIKTEKIEEVISSSENIEETYFSEWSDWTPCTKSNERQVRRRRCLNLRKCLGALMQVQNCPEIIQTTTPEPHESIRSIVSVDGDEYDEPIAVDNITVDTTPTKTTPVLNEQVWGQWQGSCQQFASSQPCNNGNMIGFESRECIAKNPSHCEGPFFRYCTLSC